MQKLPLIFYLLFFAFCQSPESTEPQDSRPNVIFILADDLGYGDISAYNPNSKIKTPNLDQLAAEGIMLTDAHSPSSVCTPTRYGILTGRYCWRSRLPQGVLRGYGRALLERDQTTVAEMMQGQGYHTGAIGKWHLGLDWVIKDGMDSLALVHGARTNEVGMVSERDPEYIDFSRKPTDGPLDHGFDYDFILPASLDMEPYCYLENDVLVEAPTAYTPGNDLETGYTEAFWRAGKMAPGFEFDQVLPTFCNKALSYIKAQAKTENPFFLYWALAAPHTPWVPTEAFDQASNAGTYGDFVTMVDDAVGQVLAAIKSNNLEENTLVIFTSDNGPFWTPELIEEHGHRSAGQWRGMKADAWEGGHRIPYIARWPGVIKAGSKSNALTTTTHLLATLADLLQVPLTSQVGEDSHSIWPVLSGNASSISGQLGIVHHSSKAFFAVRSGDWKLIQGRGSGGFSQPQVYEPAPNEAKGQLYNLKEDPLEKENLYLKHPEEVLRLEKMLSQIKN